jgi:ferredoxin
LVETGSEKARALSDQLNWQPATEKAIESARVAQERTASNITRTVELKNIQSTLQGKLDDPHWEKLGQRCLSCANCTLVCPTCFCTTVEDVTDITGDNSERWMYWDSCFNGAYSFIHGGQIRDSVQSRYRQWLTHKFTHWMDQFGVSGCVGCGRCITWCPVGIDLTEEIKALQEKAEVKKETVT